ncbi:hypothetical protein LTR36_000080 [Oleoguttula mirabilis]|uniref:GST N-terminal domain-containing protein n=1 Tax=Oleoguttula mirabilis TaxID=1507867 RepID=A0AAV9JXJ7_9PEZI|nr:hypothetical protein LTR36_000080 [Oleoguttula mirabilis]
MSGTLILYDLASRHNTAWAPNPWKTRIALNFKRIEYKTEWVEYPDLAPKFKAVGIPPNDPGAFADYSSPTVRFPDGTYVMDSVRIAKKLEEIFAEPSLHLNSSASVEADELAHLLTMALLPGVMPSVVNDILQEPSKSWFVEDREKRFGMTLEQLAQMAGGEPGWQKAEPTLQKVKELLNDGKKDDGPFVLGKTPSYSDLIIVAFFECIRRVSKDDYERLMRYDNSFGALHEACKQWTEKDD